MAMILCYRSVKYKGMSVTGMRQSGFTLIEIAIVLLVVTIILGYTLAMFPIQQELKQYRQAEQEMDRVLEAIIGFAQANGRLPCPSRPNSNGSEVGGGSGNCNPYTGKVAGDPWVGFVPVNTLGLDGDVNKDGLLIDPWGNPYRYYVTDSDFFEDANNDGDISDFGAGTDPDGDGWSDFVYNGEMRDVGLGDNAIDENNDGTDEIDSDGYLDLDPNLIVCDGASSGSDRCTGSNEVFGNVDSTLSADASGNYSTFTYTGYAGAPVVLISLGKNGSQSPSADELENRGSSLSNTDLGMTNGPSGNQYYLDTDSVYVKRTTGLGSDFDDIVKWISPSTLYSKMIAAGQLP
jgi:prepilin-type N-terminal cleavage/methylation domain-containing protein